MTEKQKAIIEAQAQEIYKPHPAPDEFWYPNRAIMPLRIGAFMEGAAAMDELDKWISCNDELPPQEPQDYYSKNVLVYTGIGCHIDSYNHEIKQWYSSAKVTHWQPIQPPKK